MRIDVHQHIWTEPLLTALSERQGLPCVVRSEGLTVLQSAGEKPYVIDAGAQALPPRQALLRQDGLDRALVALSSPIGIEALDRDSATELIEAHLRGVEALGPRFGLWGPVALERPDPEDVDRLIRRGCVGISLPAGALLTPEALASVGPVLARASALAVPVFVHPGPGPGQPAIDVSLTEPVWWQPLTAYVAQMQAAWLAFVTRGRREHPDLVVLFAMLAGGAPLLAERLRSRGGPGVDLGDARVLYESSSFGSDAIAAIARLVGESQLVYGSDRPVVEPISTRFDTGLQVNAGRWFADALEPVAANAA
ncbi:MAG: amidohydrolase family protein [Solirubrobacterales bacterium]|nr:amidohydrolase family protein [Solirubrobacterales bacterium]